MRLALLLVALAGCEGEPQSAAPGCEPVSYDVATCVTMARRVYPKIHVVSETDAGTCRRVTFFGPADPWAFDCCPGCAARRVAFCGPAPDQICGGACVNTAANDKNCGSCGVACSAGQGCCAAVCTNLIAGQCPERRSP